MLGGGTPQLYDDARGATMPLSRNVGVDRLVIPVLAMLLVAVFAIAGVVIVAARAQDDAAARQALRTVDASVRQMLERLAAVTDDYANWDEAVAALARPAAPPDPDWVARNVGPTLVQSFGITAVLVLDDAGAVRLAVFDGVMAADGAIPTELPTGALTLARQAAAAPAGQRGRASGILSWKGRLYLAAFGDLRHEDTVDRSDPGAVLVFLRALDEAVLAEIAAPLAVGAIRLGAGAVASYSALSLRDPEGTVVGGLSWTRPAPASDFLGDILWMALVIVAGLVILTVLFLTAAQRVAMERVVLADRLRDREVRLRRLVESLPELVALLRGGTLELLNGSGAAILGASQPQALLGARLEDHTGPGDRQRVADLLAEVAATGRDVGWHDLRLLAADGSAVPVRLRLLPLPELGPDIVMAVAHDMRAETRVQADLRAALAKAEVADRAKTHFLSNISHELRTPLNAIIGFSQILKDELLGTLGNAHYRDYATDIHDGGMHLLQLVNDLLDLARMDAGQFELREGWVDVPMLAARCVRVVQERAASGGVTIETDITLEGFRILADELRLKQALVNLLNNAVRASARGDAVRIWAGIDTGGDLVLRIADSGPGMTRQEIAMAMSAFGKVGDQPHQQTAGVGLGLTLAKGYAEAHGGGLTINSTPGVGTTVSIVLPKARLYRPMLTGE